MFLTFFSFKSLAVVSAFWGLFPLEEEESAGLLASGCLQLSLASQGPSCSGSIALCCRYPYQDKRNCRACPSFLCSPECDGAVRGQSWSQLKELGCRASPMRVLWLQPLCRASLWQLVS